MAQVEVREAVGYSINIRDSYCPLGALQYLVQDDQLKYLSALTEHLEDFLNDPSFVRTFHQGYLAKTKQDKRKVGEFKSRILGYLLSHCSSHASPEAQLALLQIVADVPDASKAKALQPLIEELCGRHGRSSSKANDRGLALELLRALDSSTAKLLNDVESEELWQSFLRLLRVSRALCERLAAKCSGPLNPHNTSKATPKIWHIWITRCLRHSL